jgi:hypothetical protein
MTARVTATTPVVRRATRFHHDLRAGGQRVDEPFKLAARQSLSFDDPTRTIRRRYLKDILCQVHRHRRSIHFGLLLVQLVEPKPSPRHMMPRTNREESMPINAADGARAFLRRR